MLIIVIFPHLCVKPLLVLFYTVFLYWIFVLVILFVSVVIFHKIRGGVLRPGFAYPDLVLVLTCSTSFHPQTFCTLRCWFLHFAPLKRKFFVLSCNISIYYNLINCILLPSECMSGTLCVLIIFHLVRCCSAVLSFSSPFIKLHTFISLTW